MKLIFLGAPGAGKGTQAEILGQRLGIPTISTGTILRKAMKDETPVGLRAKEYVESGALVPDEVIIDIIRERIECDDCKKGYILDGVPRTIPQAEALERTGVAITAVLLLEVSDEEIIERMAGRRACSSCGSPFHIVYNPPKRPDVCDMCGGELLIRRDDAPETVRERLRVYAEQTSPLIGFYEQRGLLRRVAGRPSISEMAESVFDALGILK